MHQSSGKSASHYRKQPANQLWQMTVLPFGRPRQPLSGRNTAHVPVSSLFYFASRSHTSLADPSTLLHSLAEISTCSNRPWVPGLEQNRQNGLTWLSPMQFAIVLPA
ncbi:hypothetical protein WAI453_012296 [Rhynchosporium graminicola]